MQKYTTDNPVFTEELPLLETTTPAHADNFNYINQQLFENTLYLNKQQKEQQTVTASDTTLGRVKLSSAVDEASDVDSGIAATPAAVKKAYNKATTAESIAKGKNRARVFNTTEDMNTWLSKAANKGVANVGDNLYIIELDVPDWWIAEVLEEPNESGLYYNIGKLETQKVDLTTIQAAIQKNTDDIGEISSNLTPIEKTITLQNAWSVTTSKCYVVGNVCYFNLRFKNGLNPSANVQQFASDFPAPKEKVAFVGIDFDNNVTIVNISISIDKNGALFVTLPVAFQHDIICSGSYVIDD